MPTSALRFPALLKPLRHTLIVIAVASLTACIDGESQETSSAEDYSATSETTAGSDAASGSNDAGTELPAVPETDAGSGIVAPIDTTNAIPVTASTITLRWETPMSNLDGTVLTDLAGYRIHWGTAPGVYTQTSVVANPDATSFTMNKPAKGTYYFAASAYDSDSNEGPRSNIASVVVN